MLAGSTEGMCYRPMVSMGALQQIAETFMSVVLHIGMSYILQGQHLGSLHQTSWAQVISASAGCKQSCSDPLSQVPFPACLTTAPQ